VRWTYQAINSSDTDNIERSKVKVTRSNEKCNKTLNICRKRHRIVEIYPSYRKSWSLNTVVTADFRPEAELTTFLRMRAKESAISLGKCIPIEELFTYYRKSRSPERMTGPDFWSEAPKLLFLRKRSENRPNNRLWCCQIATILVLLYEIVVAEHEGEGSF